MKKIFTLLAVFALSMTAMAQNEASLKVDGRDKNVLSFQMTNNFDVHGVGFKVKLPEGVTVAQKLNDDDELVPQIKKNNSRATGFKLYIDDIPGGGYSINLANPNAAFIGTEGEVAYIQLAGTLSGDVEIYDINFCDKDNKSYYVGGDNNYKITVHLNPDAINGISADETKSGVIYNMAGQRVSKATKGIYVVDGKKVAVSK
jgi:hypothetical protein